MGGAGQQLESLPLCVRVPCTTAVQSVSVGCGRPQVWTGLRCRCLCVHLCVSSGVAETKPSSLGSTLHPAPHSFIPHHTLWGHTPSPPTGQVLWESPCTDLPAHVLSHVFAAPHRASIHIDAKTLVVPGALSHVCTLARCRPPSPGEVKSSQPHCLLSFCATGGPGLRTPEQIQHCCR